nr:MAG TPA: hypothetical protein [Caudoviricetes sp.]DAM79269.1 MAG TPA: hypothetical protein [Caudoviricetes sp.]DAO83934.1 MAG TPA: hypothetical protein [Caudoviricetes sp.]
MIPFKFGIAYPSNHYYTLFSIRTYPHVNLIAGFV